MSESPLHEVAILLLVNDVEYGFELVFDVRGELTVTSSLLRLLLLLCVEFGQQVLGKATFEVLVLLLVVPSLTGLLGGFTVEAILVQVCQSTGLFALRLFLGNQALKEDLADFFFRLLVEEVVE